MTEGIIAFLCNGLVSGQVLYQILHFKMYCRFPDEMANPAQVLKSGAGKLGVCGLLFMSHASSPCTRLFISFTLAVLCNSKEIPWFRWPRGEKLHWNPRWRVVAWDLTQNRTWRLFYVLEFMLRRGRHALGSNLRLKTHFSVSWTAWTLNSTHVFSKISLGGAVVEHIGTWKPRDFQSGSASCNLNELSNVSNEFSRIERKASRTSTVDVLSEPTSQPIGSIGLRCFPFLPGLKKETGLACKVCTCKGQQNESKCGAPKTYAYQWLPLVAIIVHHFLHLGFMWDSCGYPSLWFIPTWYLWLSTRRFHVLHLVNSSTNDLCHVQGLVSSLSKSKKKNMLGQLSAAMACVTALHLTWGLHPRTSFDSTSQAFHKWPQVCHLWLQSGVLEMKDGNSWNSWSMSQSNPNWRMWLRTNSLACPQWQWNPSHLQPTYDLEGNKSSLTELNCDFQLEVVLSPSTCHGWSSQGMKVPACPWNWPDMALSHSSHNHRWWLDNHLIASWVVRWHHHT